MQKSIQKRFQWFPVEDIKPRRSYPAWISREDLCACGLRSKPPKSCRPGKHRKRILSSEEVQCLVSKGFGVVDSKVAVWDGRFLFAAGSTIKKALLSAAVAAAAVSHGQNITDLAPSARPGKLYLPQASLLHRGSDVVPWRDMDLYAASIYERPFREVDLPSHMRSYPLQQILSGFPMAKSFEVDNGKVWKRCSGVVVPTFDLCIYSPITASAEKSRFLVGKVAMVFGMLTYKMPPMKRSSPLVVVVQSGWGEARAIPSKGIVLIGEDRVVSADRSEGALLHELVHILEPFMPLTFQKRLNELYLAALPRIQGMAGVVTSDSKPPPKYLQGKDYVYAGKKIEFLTTACEAWFNAIPAHLLSAENSIGIRVTRNRADLWELFPDVAEFLSSFLAPYAFDNKDIDRAVETWLQTLPQLELKKLSDFHESKRSGDYVDGIVNRGLQKLAAVWEHVKYWLSDEDL